MTLNTRYRLGGMLVALSLGLASVHGAQAQSAGTGVITGEVDRCVSGTETPVPGANVGVLGSDAALGRTDTAGLFTLILAPGQYTIQATADDGTIASRQYVPVEANSSLDIGVLELAGGCVGTDNAPPAAPAQPAATAQPTAQPTAAPTATAVPPSPTPVPTQPAATATAVPDTDQQPSDQSSPDQQAPSNDQSPDTSSDGS